MSLLQLEINKFSSDGEVLRKIRCLAGRVTVFRSQSEGELDKFKRALEVKPQQDRFSVLLDGGPYQPQKHIFIGFGPLDEAPPQSTVGSFLEQSGIKREIVESMLTQFGLGGLSQQNCSSLAPHEWKVLRIIAASNSPEATKVIVLNEPFDEIPESFRDPLAERLAKFAWEKQAIIIVTKLSYRPNVWIENDYIARVQLERPRQGTIGFGGGESAIAEHLATLRKEHGASSVAVAKPTGPDLLSAGNSHSAAFIEHLKSPRVVGLSISLMTVIFGSMYYVWQTSAPLGSEAPSELHATLGGSKVNTGNAGLQNGLGQTGNTSLGAAANANLADALTIDGYPEPVRAAWIAAIEHPESLLRPVSSRSSKDSELQGSNPQGSPLGDSPIQALYDELTKNR